MDFKLLESNLKKCSKKVLRLLFQYSFKIQNK